MPRIAAGNVRYRGKGGKTFARSEVSRVNPEQHEAGSHIEFREAAADTDLLGLDIGSLDYLGPFLGFFDEELAEVRS
jgi:hypothetical protein